MSILRIPRHHLEHLENLALETYPEECCGVLLGQARRVSAVWPTANIHDGPKSARYAIDPVELLEVYKSARETGCQVIGYYHSHPDRAAVPSATDLASAVPDVSYLILAVSGERVKDRRAWRLSVESKGFIEEHIR